MIGVTGQIRTGILIYLYYYYYYYFLQKWRRWKITCVLDPGDPSVVINAIRIGISSAGVTHELTSTAVISKWRLASELSFS